MSTQETEQETSLEEALASNFDVENTEETQATEEVAEPTEQTEPVAEETQETEQAEVIEPPDAWSAEWKEAFKGLPSDAQNVLLDQYKSMQGDYTKKTQELGEWRRDRDQFQQIQQAIAPAIQQWNQQGMAPAQGLAQLVSYAQNLQRDPAGTLLQLAQDYKVDLNQAQDEQPYIDPAVRHLQEQIMQQNAQLQQWQQAQQQQAVEAKNNELQAFAAATDESGKTLHPHLEDLAPQMMELCQFEWSQGRPPVLEDVYRKAVALNPEISAKVSEEAKQAEARQRQAAAAKAKNAGPVVKGKTTDAPEVEMTLEEQLAANWGA